MGGSSGAGGGFGAGRSAGSGGSAGSSGTAGSGGKQGANSLTGTESKVYDLSFAKVLIVLQGAIVSVRYVGTSADPAILIVDTAKIVDVAHTSIDLTQLFSGQPRGVIQNVNAGGDGVTTQLTLKLGTVVFDQVPKLGATLSGHFNATLTDGDTLNGSFSGTVNAP
jgi:hypothetical protein